jgi:hypothetical protein
MPAQAGIQVDFGSIAKGWIPAYAGMTKVRVEFWSRDSEPLGLEPWINPFPCSRGALRYSRAQGLPFSWPIISPNPCD